MLSPATYGEAIAAAAEEPMCGPSPCEDRNNRSRQESGDAHAKADRRENSSGQRIGALRLIEATLRVRAATLERGNDRTELLPLFETYSTFMASASWAPSLEPTRCPISRRS